MQLEKVIDQWSGGMGRKKNSVTDNSFRFGMCQSRCQKSKDTMIIQTNSIGSDIISD